MKYRTKPEGLLAAIFDDSIRVGAMAAGAVQRAVLSFMEGDAAQAALVLEKDGDIGRLGEFIAVESQRFLMDHQPFAHDLFELLTTWHVSREFERMRLLAANVAALTLSMPGGIPVSLKVVQVMGVAVCAMVADAVTVYARRDTELAQDVMTRMDLARAGCANCKKAVAAYIGENPDKVARSLDILVVAGCLEQLAAAAAHIAEKVDLHTRGLDIEKCL